MKATYKNVTKLEAQINAHDLRTEYINAVDALGGYNGQTFSIATAPLARYVYLSVHQNYREADQWYVVSASDAPLTDVGRIYNRVITRTATRRVLWCVVCDNADEVAAQVNEWLCGVEGLTCAGVGIKSYLLAYKDVYTVKDKAKEFAKNFLSADRTNAP